MLNQVQHDQTKSVAELFIDFKPELSLQEIQSRFENRGRLSIKDILEKKINVSDVQIQLLKSQSTKEEYNQPKTISQLIKKFPLILTDFAPIDDAISTVGGIDLNEVTENLELKKLPNHYCLGEMLDWDAPTGGYLLQACFSMGSFLAHQLTCPSLKRVSERREI
jgi:predicted flavoprotein YhiN